MQQTLDNLKLVTKNVTENKSCSVKTKKTMVKT